MQQLTPGEAPLVAMRGIRKSFGAIEALRSVNLRLMPGEILGLVGDNSAGKSTLMKVLSGTYRKDAGDILIDGHKVEVHEPLDSRRLGIEMVYQDFALCGNLDITLNMFLGRWTTKYWLFLDKRKMDAEAAEVLKRLRVDIPSVRRNAGALSGGRQQSLAIARAISFNPKVVILDEPTANLSAVATERVLELMRELKRHGIAQIFITHRLDDVFAVADRVTVLRHGQNVGDREIRTTNEDEILGLMVRGA